MVGSWEQDHEGEEMMIGRRYTQEAHCAALVPEWCEIRNLGEMFRVRPSGLSLTL